MAEEVTEKYGDYISDFDKDVFVEMLNNKPADYILYTDSDRRQAAKKIADYANELESY